ncbi:phage tail terminator protein [Pseudomonas agarici]|uniref:phage tail terminator protein n=2 Tax=Pseudomonas agarici TaxID=46677 RepID=UPI0008D0703B|nr:hypothetical protein [Pseudomonas agarici]NWB89829.1 hypothetical protein [Pseudomonas agarici]NWC07276.1 hypothetical protein [Pseudomonas agarici]SEK49763.1 hypothetical protein SAMN05216604_103277 [Pseudomonas agarici]
MNITPILTQLRDQCPSLAQSILTGLDLELLQGNTTQPTPAAFVTVIADLASPDASQNVTRQRIRDRLELILLLDSSDGQVAFDQLHALRAELWRALVGFKPDSFYSPLEYDGGELISISADRLLYRLHFFAEFQLGRNRSSDPAETWHERELDGLPSFTGVTVQVDAIDPADPNLQRPGPDGRLELTFSGEVKQ